MIEAILMIRDRSFCLLWNLVLLLLLKKYFFTRQKTCCKSFNKLKCLDILAMLFWHWVGGGGEAGPIEK